MDVDGSGTHIADDMHVAHSVDSNILVKYEEETMLIKTMMRDDF